MNHKALESADGSKSCRKKLMLDWRRQRRFIQLDGQCQCLARRAGLLCDTTGQRIGCTYALIPNKMHCIPFNAKRQMELIGSVRPTGMPPTIDIKGVISARIYRRSVRLKSQVMLGAPLILHASDTVFYRVLAGFIVHKKNICIETVTYDALFR